MVTVDLKIDSIALTNVEFYIIDDLADCEILIWRNITERPDLMYSRVGNVFKFDYANAFTEFCNTLAELDIDCTEYQNE